MKLLQGCHQTVVTLAGLNIKVNNARARATASVNRMWSNRRGEDSLRILSFGAWWKWMKMRFSMISFMLLPWLWKSPLFLLRHHLTAQFRQWPLHSAFWGSASATVLTKVQPYLLRPKLSMNRGTTHGHDWRTFVVPIPFYPPELQQCQCLATGDAGRGVESWRWWKLLGYMSPSKSSTSSRWIHDGSARCPSCRIWILFYHRNCLSQWTTWQRQHGERRATLGWRKPHQQFQSLDLCGAAKAGTLAQRQIANLCLWKWWRTMFMQAELT